MSSYFEKRSAYEKTKVISLRRGLVFELTETEFQSFALKPCHYCRGALGQRTVVGGLDRINNDFGYILGNVLPACGICNMTRGNRFTVAETRIMIGAVVNFRRSRLGPAIIRAEKLSRERAAERGRKLSRKYASKNSISTNAMLTV